MTAAGRSSTLYPRTPGRGAVWLARLHGVQKVAGSSPVAPIRFTRGLPVAVDTAPAGPHESMRGQRLFDFMLTEQTPPRVIGDKAYDGDELDAELAEQGVELSAPHRANRKPENVTQDRRPRQR